MKFRKIVVTVEPFDSVGDGARTLKIETTVDDGTTRTVMRPIPERDFESIFRTAAVETAIQQLEREMQHHNTGREEDPCSR